MKKNSLVLFIGLVALVVCNNIYSQTTYTWNQTGNGTWSWATATNWTPTRTTPATNDILVFSNSGTKTITNIPTQTIGQLIISNNTNITLESSNPSGKILTIGNGVVGDELVIASGSSLANGGALDGITLSANSTSNISGTLTVDAGSVFNNDAAGIISTVTGTINNLGTVTCTNSTRLLFLSTGTYIHAINGGTIPTAAWNSTSNCNITGITNIAPGGVAQSFGNFTWDCLNHSGTIALNGALTTVNGDLTIKSAGSTTGMSGRTSDPLILSTSGNYTLSIAGDFNIDHYTTKGTWVALSNGTSNVTVNIGGDFNMSRTGSGPCYFDFKINTATTKGTHIMNVAGNFNLSGGYFDWTFETNGGTNQTVMNLYGNFSHTGASTIMVTSTTTATIPNGKINFARTGAQTVYSATPGNLAYTNFEVASVSSVEMLSSLYLYSSTNAPWGGQFVVNTGATLDMNTYQLLSSVAPGSNNSFILNSAANVITANVNGLQNIAIGSVSTSIATRTYSSGANYTYDGTALQNSGTFTTTPVANQVNNLTINNTAGINTTGVTLQQEFKVANVCTFISGVFTTTNTNILTLNDNATYTGIDLDAALTYMYVNGPMKKIGDDVFTFPVGKISHGCRPIYISAPKSNPSTSSEFRAELIRGNAGLLGPITATGLQKVSGCEYWYLDRLVGTSNVDVSLSWSGESPCNAQSYVTDLPNLVAAHFNGTSWDTYGNDGGTIGNAVKGTVTWNYTGPYNSSPTSTPWSLGSLVWWSNPLTVKFINLQASVKNGQVKVEWANIAETGVDKYFVEYSTDGRSFDEINNTAARKNNGERTDYGWWHTTPANGVIYYRIKAVEYTGDVTYSHIVRLDLNKNYSDLTVYPNPVKGNNVTVVVSSLAEGKYDIILLNMSGQKIMQRSLNHAGGSISLQVDLPANINAGIYSIKLSGSEKTLIKTFIVQ